MNRDFNRQGILLALVAILIFTLAYLIDQQMAAGVSSLLGFKGKTLWDWLELLFVPGVIAFGIYLLNSQESKAKILQDERLAKISYDLSLNRDREYYLQSYLERMTSLILNENLLGRDSTVVNIAQLLTITVLQNIDTNRKDTVFKFLADSGLGEFIFTNAKLFKLDLSGVSIQDISFNNALLHSIDFSRAILENVRFIHSELRDVKFNGAYIISFRATHSRFFVVEFKDSVLLKLIVENSIFRDVDINYSEINEPNFTDIRIFENGNWRHYDVYETSHFK